jgi:diguanylate cyclase (GGDEF)-like protein
MMAPKAAWIKPLEGKRDKESIRLIVAGGADYHRKIINNLACDAISLVDLAETEAALFDRLDRDEFDCLIVDQTFDGRNTLELRAMIDQRVASPPATIIVADAPDQKVILKAFRSGVSDVVTTGPAFRKELVGAVRRSTERNRKMHAMRDEIEHLSELARRDRLTGIPNRNFLDDRLTSLVAGTRRHDGTSFAMLLIVINNFDEINTIHGHAVGDQVLKAFARQLMQASRSSDAFGRLGGNEFLYLIDRDISAGIIEQVCARLSKNLAFSVDLESISIALTASIGAALCPDDGGSIDEVLNAARQAMLVAKAGGGGYHVPHTVRLTLETVADGEAETTPAEGHAAGAAERDANRRIEHRERVLRRGRIILGDGFSTIDCVIRDISAHGARFTVQEGIAIPRTLSLAIPDTGRTHQAIRRWQRGASIGVEFTTEAAGHRDDKAA